MLAISVFYVMHIKCEMLNKISKNTTNMSIQIAWRQSRIDLMICNMLFEKEQN